MGYVVSAEGIAFVKEYVVVVVDWSFFIIKFEVRVFLGKVTYYKDYLKDFFALAVSWYVVTGKIIAEEEKVFLIVIFEMVFFFDKFKNVLFIVFVFVYF